MIDPHFNRQRLEELLFASVTGLYSAADCAELNAILRDNADARKLAAQWLAVDAVLTESLAASAAGQQYAMPCTQAAPVPSKLDFRRSRWLAQAAAWVGAFHLFGTPAQAATATIATTAKGSTILTKTTIAIIMKKTVTSITAAILILGGSGIYAIHRTNASSRARVESMENEIQALSDQLGIRTTSFANRRTGATKAKKTVSVSQVVAIYDDGNQISRQEKAILAQFKNQLAAMDAEELKNLLLDAEKISSPINAHLAVDIMDELVRKDPAMATQIASQLIGRSSEFQFHLSHSAVKAFDAWLAKDPAAADAWYVATAAAGGLNSKNIPMSGLEELLIDRSFARSRFSAQLRTNPAEAAAMLAAMLPADVTAALKSVTDPDALRQILPKLSPAQKGPAAEGAIKAMAVMDLDAAFTWANSLEMGERERDSLLATGIEAAVENGKLDLPGVAERSKDLKLDAKRRSEMLVSAATSVSLIPRKNENIIEADNSVHWDRTAERIDWLRKEAPADSADKMVGQYLGTLAYASHNVTKSLESYENEVSRQGKIHPDLTIQFANYLSNVGSDSAYAAALKLLDKLPASEQRDNSIESIKMNH